MNVLSWIFVVKIAATVLVWCVPLLAFPDVVLDALGFPPQATYLFVRLLGWASVLFTAAISAGLFLFGARWRGAKVA